MLLPRGTQEIAGGAIVLNPTKARKETIRVHQMGAHKTVILQGAVVYLIDARAADQQIVLPSGVVTPCPFVIKKVDDSTHTVIVRPSSGTIDGAAMLTLNLADRTCTVIYDGEDWYRI